MKYYGKEKCRILKQIRAEIARENDIEWVVSECKHKGNCKGTCPKCEQEVRQLEAALAKREALGKTVAVVGISASIALSVTGCVNPFPSAEAGEPIAGDMPFPDTSAEETYIAVDGEMIPPPETETACDLPLAGAPVEQETEEPLMGDVAIEGEFIEETDEETTDDTSEETTEPEIVDIMGEPAE